jgi:hypothetical protein
LQVGGNRKSGRRPGTRNISLFLVPEVIPVRSGTHGLRQKGHMSGAEFFVDPVLEEEG